MSSTMAWKICSQKQNWFAKFAKGCSRYEVRKWRKRICDVCNTEKVKRLPISCQVATRAKKPLDIVHVDMSPVNTTSIVDFKYALGFVDSFSRLDAVYLLRTRALEVYRWAWNSSLRLSLIRLKSSNLDICLQQGIHQEFTCEYTPVQNGKKARVWGTINAIARCLLETRVLPEPFWSFAYRAAFFWKNRCLHSAHGTTPFEKFFDKTPDVSHFWNFGCQAFLYLEKPKRKKIDSFLLGFGNNSELYLIGFLVGAELPGKTHFANIERVSEFAFELNDRKWNRVAKHGISRDTQNLICDVSELQNGDLGGNPETLVTERSDEIITQIQSHSSTMHTTTRYGRIVKPPNRYTPGTSSNLSYVLSRSGFDESETVAYHSDYVDHELLKKLQDALSPP